MIGRPLSFHSVKPLGSSIPCTFWQLWDINEVDTPERPNPGDRMITAASLTFQLDQTWRLGKNECLDLGATPSSLRNSNLVLARIRLQAFRVL